MLDSGSLIGRPALASVLLLRRWALSVLESGSGEDAFALIFVQSRHRWSSMILARFLGSARLSHVKPLGQPRVVLDEMKRFFVPPIRDLGAARDAGGLRITVIAH